MRKVIFHPPKAYGLATNSDQIDDPLEKGYFVEAAAIADAFIDNNLLYMSALYGERKTQHPSGKPVSGKEHLNFLHQKGDIPDTLNESIIVFKNDRNVMAHEIHGEYNLLFDRENSWWDKYKTQKEIDERVRTLAREVVENGKNAFFQLENIFMNHPKNPARDQLKRSGFL
ncbi:MAG: hypothetical protein Q8P05_05450 [Candidatus Diapherotrites archaeon]|nr:hypothetical protein [Candidatus Diapherotrites archaeon]